ncbi:hypothetical protein CLAIMM_07689 isoform 1 [Cladophialophora immunda]|nr:hypothetical protein CLAIMM_07689 isoform 1 [Cladophialophora immunda]
MTSRSSLSPSPTKAPRPFLSLPSEIRLKIYPHVFFCAQPLRITPSLQAIQYRLNSGKMLSISSTCQLQMMTFSRDGPSAPMGRAANSCSGVRLSSQILRVCRQVYAEALPILYHINMFECSVRSAHQNITRVVSTPNFRLIRHLVLDCAYVKDLLSLLAQEEQAAATGGLEVLELRSWPKPEWQSHPYSLGVRRRNEASIDFHPPMRSSTRPPDADPRWEERQLLRELMEICKKTRPIAASRAGDDRDKPPRRASGQGSQERG